MPDTPPGDTLAHGPAGRVQLAVSIFLIILTIAACWIIPLRLAYGPYGSRYTFGYIGDEYMYASRVQPLIPGASAANPVNGVCDPEVISPFFFEDSCRALLTVTRLDVITFMWLLRFVVPAGLAMLLVWLSFSCFWRETEAKTSPALPLAAAAAAFPLLYNLYDVITVYPPLAGWINRTPTNVEYLLSAGVACLFVRLILRPDARRGALLAISAVVLAYMRPYAAIPWFMAISAGSLTLLITRRMSLQTAGVMLLCLLGLLPMFIISIFNARSDASAQQMARYFELPRPYQIDPRWAMRLGLGGVFTAAAILSSPRLRPLAIGSAAAMFAVPFVSGLLPYASELHDWDRYGAFCLIALLAVMLAIFSERVRARGKAAGAALAMISLAGTALLAHKNYNLDFFNYERGPYESIVEDLAYERAYLWVRDSTPADALFLVDDGFDWSKAPDEPRYLAIRQEFVGRDDLFQIIARRRRVYTERLYVNCLSNDDVYALTMLQRGTFGYPVDGLTYGTALKRFLPDYVFWRKFPPQTITAEPAPIPRGHGEKLRGFREAIVYEDNVCEIWKMNYKSRAGQ